MSFAVLTAPVVDIVWLARITLANSRVERVFAGLGEIRWNGEVWQGLGEGISIGEVSGSTDLQASGLDFSIPGLPAEYRAALTGESAQGGKIELLCGALEPGSDTWARAPQVEAVRIIDTVTIQQSGADEGAGLTALISTIDAAAYVRKRRAARYTPEDYEQSYPGTPSMRFRAGLRGGTITGTGIGIPPNPSGPQS